MSRKNRPYHFYDTTGSICSTCFRQIEAKILFKDSKVYMDKWCPQHGTERVLGLLRFADRHHREPVSRRPPPRQHLPHGRDSAGVGVMHEDDGTGFGQAL